MRRLLALFAVVVAVAVACGDGNDSTDAPAAPSRVTGVVVEVESRGLGRVDGFTLKDGDDFFEISIDEDIDYGFRLDHLTEHRASAEPVTVELEERAGELVALSIKDAPTDG